MNAKCFDEIATGMAHSGTTTRRAMLGVMLGGVFGLVAREGTSAAKQKSKHRSKSNHKQCKQGQSRCQQACVNLDTDSQNCGSCGHHCTSSEQCLHGRCFSDDICPAQQKACPNFIACGVDDSDCFCGTTTGGQTVCFQDEDFCETPRPCQSTSDCEVGRVCIDSSDCCAARNLPDVPRTCLLPCEHLATASQLSGKSAHGRSKSRGERGGPGQ